MKNKLILSFLFLFPLFVNSSFSADEKYDKYIGECTDETFKNNLIRLYENDPALTTLCMGISSLHGEAIQNIEAISWATTNNTHLTELNNTGSNIRDEGAQILANMLKKNKGILRLNLTNNHIGEDGATALAEAIQLNQNLLDINLDLNGKIHGKNGSIDSIIDSISRNRKRQGLFPLTKE